VEPHYATGQSLAAAGVVAGRDMTPEAALVKLGWLLGSGRSSEEVRKQMSADLRGEITSHRTQKFSLSDGGFLRSVFTAIQDRELDTEGGAVGGPPGTPTCVAAASGEGGNGLAALRAALMPTLLCAAAGSGDLDAIGSMVADGAVLATCADYDGRTPLHLAASEGREAVVAYLIQPEHGMSLSAQDRAENTALANAAKYRKRRVIVLLVEAGAKLALAEHRLAGILCSLVKARDHAGLECYTAARADVCAADYDNRTALHVAAADGNTTATTMLLAAGANPAALDRWGRTPYHESTLPNDPDGGLVANEGHEQVAAILKEHADKLVAAALTRKSPRPSPDTQRRPASF
jgi:lysophospholipase